jgi:hypothetical protein
MKCLLDTFACQFTVYLSTGVMCTCVSVQKYLNSTPLIEDGNTLELFTLDLHCARIHQEKCDIAVKNIKILILAA